MGGSPFPALSELGERICIFGPSNSGKSTLAHAIGCKAGLMPVHLDQLYFVPQTQWQPRPFAEFSTLHDAAIAKDKWVMEGNYSACLGQRLARASAIIVLDQPRVANLIRYIWRSLSGAPRIGDVSGTSAAINRGMIHHILHVQPANMPRYRMLCEQSGIAAIGLTSMAAVNRLYHQWQLER